MIGKVCFSSRRHSCKLEPAPAWFWPGAGIFLAPPKTIDPRQQPAGMTAEGWYKRIHILARFHLTLSEK